MTTRGRYTPSHSEHGTAQGQMKFWDVTLQKWVATETSELVFLNEKMGINQAVPTSTLDVNGTVTVKRLLAGGITE